MSVKLSVHGIDKPMSLPNNCEERFIEQYDEWLKSGRTYGEFVYTDDGYEKHLRFDAIVLWEKAVPDTILSEPHISQIQTPSQRYPATRHRR